MSEKNRNESSVYRSPADRRKRVNRLKKIIIGAVVCAILIPVILCIVLLVRVNRLEEKLTRLEEAQACMEASAFAEAMKNTGDSGDMESAAVMEDEGNVEPGKDSGPDDAAGSAGFDNGEPVIPENQEEQAAEWDGIRRVYLTFDDGPSGYTDDILEILDRYGVKATFFVVGKTDANSVEMYKQIVLQGHTLGMHSYSHVYHNLYASVESFKEDLQQLRGYLYVLTGVDCSLYRFPGGSSNTVSQVDMQEFIKVLQEEEITYFDWNASCGDGGSRLLSVEELVDNTMANIEDYHNVVILMHDSVDKSTTVEALPLIIEQLQELPDTEILPITEDTVPVQHVRAQ